MLKLDFPQKYSAELIRILDLYAPKQEIWAYGSRIKGNNHEASDLDLVIKNPLKPLEKFKELDQLRIALSESNIPIIIDVMDWARIPEHFREEILKEHLVLKT